MRLQRHNMDSTWLLELSGTRLLIDPWLEGVEVDYFRWFNQQWHQTPPLGYVNLPPFDAVLVTQKYPDHFHRETLARLAPPTVFAPASLRRKLVRLLPQATVHCLDTEDVAHSFGALRLRLLPSRRRLDPIYDAFLLDDGVSSVLLAPHGIALDEGHLEVLQEAPPCALLLSPFNRYQLPAFLGGVVTPGLEALRELVRLANPTRVVRTHDEQKHARGLIPALARITPFDEASIGAHPWLASRLLTLPDYEQVTL